MTDDTRGQGDNLPNAFASLQDRTNDLVANANRWLQERPEIENSDQADKCKDFIDQLKAEAKAVEQARKAEKQPHMDASRAVDDKYRPLGAVLDKAIKLLNPALTKWLQKQQAIQEAERKRREEEALAKIKAEEDAKRKAEAENTVEAHLAAEQAEDEADRAALVADRAARAKASTKGQFGGRATSLRTYRTVEIVNIELLFEHYKGYDEVRNVLTRLAAADVKAKREVPGIKIHEERRAV